MKYVIHEEEIEMKVKGHGHIFYFKLCLLFFTPKGTETVNDKRLLPNNCLRQGATTTKFS